MEIVLAVATILGGIVAIWFLWEKFFLQKLIEKEVNNSWWEASPLKQSLEKEGYSFRWSNAESVEDRLNNGYKIIYEKTLFKKYKLVNKSGQVLIGKNT
jgi:cell division septal protein FtsQ